MRTKFGSQKSKSGRSSGKSSTKKDDVDSNSAAENKSLLSSKKRHLETDEEAIDTELQEEDVEQPVEEETAEDVEEDNSTSSPTSTTTTIKAATKSAADAHDGNKRQKTSSGKKNGDSKGNVIITTNTTATTPSVSEAAAEATAAAALSAANAANTTPTSNSSSSSSTTTGSGSSGTTTIKKMNHSHIDVGANSSQDSSVKLQQRRESHKEVERRRRENINSAISKLHDLVNSELSREAASNQGDEDSESNGITHTTNSSPKAMILFKACQYIENLNKKLIDLREKSDLLKLLNEQELTRLSTENENLKNALEDAYKLLKKNGSGGSAEEGEDPALLEEESDKK